MPASARAGRESAGVETGVLASGRAADARTRSGRARGATQPEERRRPAPPAGHSPRGRRTSTVRPEPGSALGGRVHRPHRAPRADAVAGSAEPVSRATSPSSLPTVAASLDRARVDGRTGRVGTLGAPPCPSARARRRRRPDRACDVGGWRRGRDAGRAPRTQGSAASRGTLVDRARAPVSALRADRARRRSCAAPRGSPTRRAEACFGPAARPAPTLYLPREVVRSTEPDDQAEADCRTALPRRPQLAPPRRSAVLGVSAA